ncbi:MAG TPA: class I adenylate-forming enzyme family protein [Methanocorpusculum sp.]|nr:class I adenylate-forming enzyme family protein [Methanocorpusculum sp.]
MATERIYQFTPERLSSLYALLKYGSELAGPDGEALQYFGRGISYGELLDSINLCAAGFTAEGVKPGDSITIYLPNIPQCIVAIYAINRIGAICNLVHPLLSRSELEYAVQLTKSRFILAFESNEGVCRGLGAKVIRCRTPSYFPTGMKGAVMRAVFTYSVRSAAKSIFVEEWDELIENGRLYLANGGTVPERKGTARETAAIMYTGGTTGQPKGVLLSNEAMNRNAATLISSLFHDHVPALGTSFLGVLPAFHAFGFGVTIHQALCGGMRLIMVPKFEPKSCAKLILKEKISAVVGVAAMFEKMYPYLKDEDLLFIRIIGGGGDLMSSDLIDKYNAILPNAVFRLGYGMTEVCGCCLFTGETDNNLSPGAVGLPMGDTELCLTNPGTTTVIPNSSDGELCVRNSSLMTGYYQNEKATAGVLRKHADGKIWLHTGDMVTIDANSNVIFKSRYKRMVKVNGFNVYPSVIENTMSLCPLINEICAVGIPWEESARIKLYVTLMHPEMNHEEASEEIKQYAFAHLNRWSCPKEVHIIPEMPRTKLNKVDYTVFEEHESEKCA